MSLRSCATRRRSCSCCARCALFAIRVSGRGGHVFLVPDEGAAAITALHDRLYEGALAPYLRADLPFVPHMTVGAHGDFAECERVCDRLRGTLPPIRGVLDAADLIEVHDGVVRTAASYRMCG